MTDIDHATTTPRGDHGEAARAQTLPGQLHPDALATPEADASDLRRIGGSRQALERARAELDHAVGAARGRGRSWGAIGMVLGVTRQAARQRFRHLDYTAQTP